LLSTVIRIEKIIGRSTKQALGWCGLWAAIYYRGLIV